MAEKKDPWFVLERSEALASLLFTNQSGVAVDNHQWNDDGADLLVGLDGRSSRTTRLFLVLVKGTLSTNPADWTQKTNQVFRAEPLHLPTCVVVVNVRDNTARYAWIAEPVAESDRVTLAFPPSPAFAVLDDEAVAEIVARVKAFYDALPKQLLPAG